MYKAIVKNEKKEMLIIESQERNKSEFIKNLRANGYKVDNLKVKKSEVFDYIMNNTNCNKWDWKENN